MATKAQIDANRENAKKSTGPRTAEGKEATRPAPVEVTCQRGYWCRVEAVIQNVQSLLRFSEIRQTLSQSKNRLIVVFLGQ